MGPSDSGSAPDKQGLAGNDMEQAGRWPKLTWEQQVLCAKVRVIDKPDRLVERLSEIDPSVYQPLLTDIGLPPTHLTFENERAAAVVELVLAMALVAEGCVIPGCDDQSETAVVFLMFGGELGVLPGSLCPRHVQTRTRLRKLGTFLAYTTGAALPLLAGLVANELKENVGLRDNVPRDRLRRLVLRPEALRRAGLHDPTPRQYRQRTQGVLGSIFGGDPGVK